MLLRCDRTKDEWGRPCEEHDSQAAELDHHRDAAVLLGLNYFLQIRSVRADMVQDSEDRFWQIGQVLQQNEAESEQIQRDFKNNCLIRAKAAAYIVQYRPEIIGDQREMDKIAELLQVDEFHLFDQEGTIYAGSWSPNTLDTTLTPAIRCAFSCPCFRTAT